MFVLLLLAACGGSKGIDLDNPEDCVETAWFTDGDADGYGTGAPAYACVAPKGAVAEAGDCNDEDPDISPGVYEACNGYDDDCDGAIDDDDPMADGSLAWFRDADGDRHGNKNQTAVGCVAPEGYVGTADDCDDGDGSVHPGAKDECDDGVDSDCNGSDCPAPEED